MDVCFDGESAFGEGVARDWLGILAKELFYNSELFAPCPARPMLVHPQAYDKAWMEFAGKICIFASCWLSQVCLIDNDLVQVGSWGCPSSSASPWASTCHTRPWS